MKRPVPEKLLKARPLFRRSQNTDIFPQAPQMHAGPRPADRRNRPLAGRHKIRHPPHGRTDARGHLSPPLDHASPRSSAGPTSSPPPRARSSFTRNSDKPRPALVTLSARPRRIWSAPRQTLRWTQHPRTLRRREPVARCPGTCQIDESGKWIALTRFCFYVCRAPRLTRSPVKTSPPKKINPNADGSGTGTTCMATLKFV